MKSFRLFAITDRHDHSDFDKLYACFVSYVGRERLRGDRAASLYQLDMESCRKEYDDICVLGTLDRSNAAVSMIRTSIQQHTEKVSQARGGTIDEPETTKASTQESVPEEISSSSPVTESVSAQSTRKRAREACITEEPWHSLVLSLTKLINGESNVTFPSPLPNMSPSHVHLFEHAVDSLMMSLY